MRRAFSCQSPFQRYLGWKKTFSVTDLVSPAWCEVQYEYGLRQQRHKPLERRPSSFVSAAGKEIQVQQSVAVQNDRRLKRGKLVHAKLEREIHPEQITVTISTEEERWGLRLFTMITGLEEIVLTGITREFPIFGLTHGQVVIGIIDEIQKCHIVSGDSAKNRKRPSPSSSPVKKKPRQHMDLLPSSTTPPYLPQHALDEADNQIPESIDSDIPTDQSSIFDDCPHSNGHPYNLRVIDYKTRRSSSLPTDEDSISSKLQLMLYCRMLSSILSPGLIDFAALWNQLELNPIRVLSDRFMDEIGWRSRSDPNISGDLNLNQLVELWWTTVHSVQCSGYGLAGVNSELQIIYRRSKSIRSTRKEQTKDTEQSEELLEQEDLDLARAIEESLRSAKAPEHEGSDAKSTVNDTTPTRAPGPSTLLLPSTSTTAESALPCLPQSTEDVDCDTTRLNGTVNDRARDVESIARSMEHHASKVTASDEATSSVIGTKEFQMDDVYLDTYLTNVLEWWLGHRLPRGVELANSNRCFTCEYNSGCEWREQKANEMVQITRQNKDREHHPDEIVRSGLDRDV
ncbi:exonuclease V [Hygrophoropsis aurantiaca]|uniref:Exonuclease V n=1 Tax=Hygrophoropsis aurantiaca TaxID=72124 RepID=A0ACB8AN91_9AGAM|nr:exonuclease V [Hygrophoropsis aurantiaca]